MNDQSQVKAQTSLHGLHVKLLHDINAIESDWRWLSSEATSTAYQSFDWVKTTCTTFEQGNTPFILTASHEGKPAFIIPLILEKGFPSVLRWPGNNHSNICCGLFSREILNDFPEGLLQELISFLQQSLPGTILLHLKNQPETLGGYPNPLLELSYQVGPNPLFTIDLTDGFDAILDAGNGKRKRKLYRRQCREAEKLGGFELFIPKTKEDIAKILDDFFRLKASRFEALGITDVFAPEKARNLISELATAPERGNDHTLRLFVLNVNGKMRAMYGASITEKRCYSFINAVEYDDFAEESPGEMVLYMMIEHLVNEGFEYFDIGIGHERYKFSWCKNPTPLYETIKPIGFAAKPLALYIRLLTGLKERVKANPMVWNKIKQIRRIRSKLFG